MADNEEKKKKEGKQADQLATPVSAERGQQTTTDRNITGWPDTPLPVSVTAESLDVTLQGTPVGSTFAQGFWEYLRQRTDAISFGKYTTYIDEVLCRGDAKVQPGAPAAPAKRIAGVDTYQLLRAATEAFLLVNCGSITDAEAIRKNEIQPHRFGGTTVDLVALRKKLTDYLGGDATIPYIDRITEGLDFADKDHAGNAVFCENLDEKVLQPCFIELIWSYWHEEAAVVQAINAISLRFQNKRTPGDTDPLAALETHPLRPLANLLWGYVQDEDHRLTVARRAYEYEHQYGLSLVGKAVPKHAPADRRSQFLVAFHTLLHQAAIFYDRSANLTVRADAFPLLNALHEVHLVLAEGAHNQFRELPWTARVEMLIQQWLLSRREVREFIGGRQAVPYAEEWMRTVDALRRVMGWGDTSISHFHDLAITGEKIVLSVRFGDWSSTGVTEFDATGWVVFWRPEIQRYIHAYQAVTGVDLSAATQVTNRQIDATLPSVLLQQRMARVRR